MPFVGFYDSNQKFYELTNFGGQGSFANRQKDPDVPFSECAFQAAKLHYIDNEEIRNALLDKFFKSDACRSPSAALDFMTKEHSVEITVKGKKVQKKVIVNSQTGNFIPRWHQDNSLFELPNKDVEMAYVLLTKFDPRSKNKNLYDILMEATQADGTVLVETSRDRGPRKADGYWGWGNTPDKVGENRLGLMLTVIANLYKYNKEFQEGNYESKLQILLPAYKETLNHFKNFDFHIEQRLDNLILPDVLESLDAQFARFPEQSHKILFHGRSFDQTTDNTFEATKANIKNNLAANLKAYKENPGFYNPRIPIPIDFCEIDQEGKKDLHFGYVVIDLDKSCVVIGEPLGRTKYDTTLQEYRPFSGEKNYTNKIDEIHQLIKSTLTENGITKKFTFLSGPPLQGPTLDCGRLVVGMLDYLTTTPDSLYEAIQPANAGLKKFNQQNLTPPALKKQQKDLTEGQTSKVTNLRNNRSRLYNYYKEALETILSEYKPYPNILNNIISNVFFVYHPNIKDIREILQAASPEVKQEFKAILSTFVTMKPLDINKYKKSLRDFLPKLTAGYHAQLAARNTQPNRNLNPPGNRDNQNTNNTGNTNNAGINQNGNRPGAHESSIQPPVVNQPGQQPVQAAQADPAQNNNNQLNFVSNEKLESLRNQEGRNPDYRIENPVQNAFGEDVANVVNTTAGNEVVYEIYKQRFVTKKQDENVFKDMLLSYKASCGDPPVINTLQDQDTINKWIRVCYALYKDNREKLSEITINGNKITAAALNTAREAGRRMNQDGAAAQPVPQPDGVPQPQVPQPGGVPQPQVPQPDRVAQAQPDLPGGVPRPPAPPGALPKAPTGAAPPKAPPVVTVTKGKPIPVAAATKGEPVAAPAPAPASVDDPLVPAGQAQEKSNAQNIGQRAQNTRQRKRKPEGESKLKGTVAGDTFSFQPPPGLQLPQRVTPPLVQPEVANSSPSQPSSTTNLFTQLGGTSSSSSSQPVTSDLPAPNQTDTSTNSGGSLLSSEGNQADTPNPGGSLLPPEGNQADTPNSGGSLLSSEGNQAQEQVSETNNSTRSP